MNPPTAQTVINACYFVPMAACIALIVWAQLSGMRSSEYQIAQRGKVGTSQVQQIDHLGLLILLAIFGSLLVLNQMPSATGENAEPKEITITPFILIFAMISQAAPAGVVLIFLLATNRSPVSFFALLPKWKDARLMFVAVPMAITLTYLFMIILGEYGFNGWLQSVFGEDAKMQEIVRIYQETDAIIIRVLLAFMAIVVAPLVEETVFRGYLYPILKRHGGAAVAVILSSLMFAAVHDNIMGLLPLFVLAVILALSYELTRSLWTPILIHVIFNSITIVAQEIARHGATPVTP